MIKKIVSIISFAFAVITITIFLLLQIKPVQSYFARQIVEEISKNTEHSVSIGEVEISWIDQIALLDFLVLDYQQDTLLYSKKININYDLFHLLNKNNIYFEKITSSNIVLRIVKYDEDFSLNLTYFLKKIRKNLDSEKQKLIIVDDVVFNNLNISYTNKTKERQIDRFDFSNVNFNIPTLQAENLEINKDSITANIFELAVVENYSKFQIDNLKTRISFQPQKMIFYNLDVQTPYSHVTDYVHLSYDTITDLAVFIDKVDFKARLVESDISHEDVAIFLGVTPFQSDMKINATLIGKFKNFDIKNGNILIDSSLIQGDMTFIGLPQKDKIFVISEDINVIATPSDFKQYFNEKTAKKIDYFDKVHFNGSFVGFFNDFVTNGTWKTNKGTFYTDLNIKKVDDVSKWAYHGDINCRDLNIKRLIEMDGVDRLNMNAKIDGKGIELENINIDLNATIFNSDFNGYRYDEIRIEGKYYSNFFKGNYQVKDPNCMLQGEALVDLNDGFEILHIKTIIDSIKVNRLNFINETLVVKSKLQLDAVGFYLDHFTGDLRIDSTFIALGKRQIFLDSLVLRVSTEEDSTRKISFAIPGLTSELTGTFEIKTFWDDLTNITYDYFKQINLLTDSVTNKVRDSTSTYELHFYVDIQDVSNYIETLDIPLTVSKNTTIRTDIQKNKTIDFSTHMSSPYVKFADVTMIEPRLDITGSCNIQDKEVLNQWSFISKKQKIENIINTEKFVFNGNLEQNKIDFSIDVDHPDTQSSFKTNGSAVLEKDSISLNFSPSKLKLFDEYWNLNPDNLLVFQKGIFSLLNFFIHNRNESLGIGGKVDTKRIKNLNIVSKNIALDKFNIFLEKPLEGTLNGSIQISEQNEKVNYHSQLLLTNFSYDSIYVGDIHTYTKKDSLTDKHLTYVDLVQSDQNIIVANGFSVFDNYQPQLDMKVSVNQLDLELFNTLFPNRFIELDGKISGNLTITENIFSPKVEGTLYLEKGQVKVDYLNTSYAFSGKIDLESSSIKFNDVILIDRREEEAIVSGSIVHDGFSDVLLNLTIQAKNFELLNTNLDANTLYYGSGYGSGTLEIQGSVDDIKVKGHLKTESDTRIYIPLTQSETENVEQKDFITFINLSDTIHHEIKKIQESLGMTFDCDIEVTPDAYCELIFSERGDIMRGRSKGNIKLFLNTEGILEIFGSLDVVEGKYNYVFSIGNASVINKQFEVIPGSNIAWLGDPYGAILDLETTYLQRASFEDLVHPTQQIESDLDNTVPLYVILDLNGNMLSPQIGFDIRLQEESKNITDELLVQLNQIRNDEQELKRQALSLIFLRKFSPIESFTLGGGDAWKGSLSEVLSNQVSYLISQLDENLELEVEVNDLDSDAFRTLQLRLAYTFLDGRLKVVRGGGFGNQQEENIVNNIMGDWSIEYSVIKDGKIRAKVFRNSAQRISNQIPNGDETGMSLRFIHSFDRFKKE